MMYCSLVMSCRKVDTCKSLYNHNDNTNAIDLYQKAFVKQNEKEI